MSKERKQLSPKPTNAERRRRLDIVESLLTDCATVTDIRRYFAEKEGLRLGRRTVERYRELAEKRILKCAEPMRDREIRYAKLRLERCFARAISGGKKNILAAIAAQKAINTLLGLNAPKDPTDNMSVEELAKLVLQQQREREPLA